MEAIQTTQRRMHQTKQTTMFDPIRWKSFQLSFYALDKEVRQIDSYIKWAYNPTCF
jgi:hypothetical protein